MSRSVRRQAPGGQEHNIGLIRNSFIPFEPSIEKLKGLSQIAVKKTVDLGIIDLRYTIIPRAIGPSPR